MPKSHLQHVNISIKSHFIYTATNVLAREPTVIAHPSTRTNNSNLNGKETNIGESIIMPKDINDNSYLPIKKYLEHLDACYKKYLLKYEINKHFKEMHIGPFNLQKYKQSGHFNGLHSERMGISSSSRLFAWMTYHNDVDDGGQTNFSHYNIKIKPETSKTLIWPAEWTHAHTGEILKSGTKYIVTGWMHFPLENK